MVGRWNDEGLIQEILPRFESETTIDLDYSTMKELVQKYGPGIEYKTHRHLMDCLAYRFKKLGQFRVKLDYNNGVITLTKITPVLQQIVSNSDETTSGVITRATSDNMSEFIPKTPIKYKERKVTDKVTDKELVKKLLENKKPVLLVGPTGSGKNTLLESICYENNWPYVRIPLDGSCDVEDIIGFYTMKNGSIEWRDGLLTRAVRYGGLVVLDEINSANPEILFAIHSLLEDNPKLIIKQTGEVIEPHPEFRLAATMNPTNEGYSGTQMLNKALLSRFYKLYIDYLPKSTEASLIAERTGIEKVDAIKLVTLATDIRNSSKEGLLSFTLGTRDLIQIAEMSVMFNIPVAEAAKIQLEAIADSKAVLEHLSNVFGNRE